MPEITKAIQSKYVTKGGIRCPWCESSDITGGFVEVDTGTAWQPMSCTECDAEWEDQYVLTGISAQR